MKEEKDLNMDMFSTDPYVDFSDAESEKMNFLFSDEAVLEGEADTDEQETGDDTVDNDDNITIESEQHSDTVDGNSDEEDVDGDDSAQTGADDSSSDPNFFNSLTALLSEKGLISTTESEVTDEDSFVELFKKEIKKSEYSDLTEEQRYYLDNLRNGVPEKKLETDLIAIRDLNSITEEVIQEDGDLRQRIIYQDFINKGYNDDRARKYLQRSIDLGTDVEDATDAMASIRKFTEANIAAENQRIADEQKALKEAEENRIKGIKSKILSTDEVIKGYKISSAVKEKIQKNMFDIVDVNPNTKQNENALMKYRRENPEDFDVKLYYMFTITDGFKNFDSLIKNTKSKALKDLKTAMESSTKITDPGSPAYLQDPESYSIEISGHDIVVD